MSVSASYAESPVQQPPPRHLTETATQATSVTTHIVESSQHEIVSKRTVQVKAPLITETASLELPTPEPVRKTSLVEATQFVKRSTVDQQIDTVPVSSSDVGAQTEPHKSLLDGAAHLSLKRTDATSQAKPVQLCMVDSWSEIHAPVVPVQQPPKPIQTLEACVQTVKESVCVVDSATSVSVKSPESVLDSPDYPLLLRDNVHFIPSYLVDSSVCAIPSFVDCWCQCSFSSLLTSQLVDDCVYVSGDDSLLCPLVDSCCKMVVVCSSFGTSTEPLKPVFHEPKIPNLIDTSGFFHVDHDYLPSTIQDEDVPLDSGDLEWELVDDNLKDLHRCLVDSFVQTEESYICRPDSQKEYSPSLPGSQLPTVNRKNFSVQYIYEPAQENAGCQTQPMTFDKIQKHIIIDNQDAETMTDDIDSKVAVLFQNISSTDIRERLIERYYYSAPSSAVLVTDAEVQVNLTGSVYKGHTKGFYMKDISTDYVVEHHIENENVILEESSGHDDSEQTVSGTSYSRYTKRLLHEGSVTEVWEKCPPTHSVFDYYQSRREFGSVREQASMAMEEPVTAADVGIQIVFDSLSHSSPSESEISRSESPLSGSSYTYEAYLIRSRLGQVCEVQCQFCPTHIPTASQTDHYGISMQTERHEKFKEDIFEIYQRRLIKDQIAEAWTQVEQDSYTESRMEQVSEPIDVIEERILEITEKKSKKVYSQIKITEEFTEEEDLIVCELGVQTDPFYDQQYFIKTKESHSSMDLREESSRRLSTTGIQTSVIHLASIISSGDLEWADEDLCEVIKAGIRLLGSDGHKSEDISVSKYRSHQLNICSRLPTDSGEKVLISSGTQAIPIESDLEKKFQKDWQVEDISIHESAERFQSDDIVEKVGMLTEETHHMSKILVQLRQRTLQYELFESQYSTSCIQWNNIREVASPRTGLFAPVAMAIRRGWIRLGEVNEYVDPMTGVAIPLETAYQQGRIRLTSSSSHYDRNIITNTPVLLLIERVYFSWCKAYLTSVVNTATGEVLSPNLAIANGILETTEDEIRLLDSLTNTWITIEEGAGRQIIQLEPSTPTTESMEDELDEPVSCKVYQLTHVCPGGEPSPWLGPLEAVRLGLLNWETGEVAADWPARPMLRSMNSTGHLLAEDFIPTKWCSFLTAKQAGWLRFIEEIEPQRYLTTSGTPNKEPGSLILSTQVNLLAPSQVSLNYEHDDIEENYHHQTNQYHHEFNIPRTRSDDVFTTRDLSTSNLYHPFNILPDTRSVSCTRIDITSPLYNDYKLIPSRMQVRHENDEHSWTSETQIWEEYQETSSRTISPDNARGHQ
uniref:RRM domain-containing protein n=1 Tax=Schistosoma mansoni TaxID=6183 RepID=A0A5K4F3L3_SCHMA